MNASKYFIAIFLLIAFSFSDGYSQKKSKAQLEKEKKESLQKIAEAEKILSQTSSKRKNSIGELYAIQQQIKEREKLIKSIKGELTYIASDIDDTNEIVASLESDLNQLKEEYAMMVYNTYKTTRGQSKLAFLFSSSTFNQFAMRLKYMEQYGIARRKQTEQINKIKAVLSGQVNRLEDQIKDKNKLLNEQLSESKKLDELKNKQNDVVNSLASREKEIKKQIEEKKKSIAQLNAMIDDIIKEEIAKLAAAKKATAVTATPAASILAESFAANKGKLPWPVDEGFVTQDYGKQQHPVWKNVITDNKGVDIQTNSSQKVRTVFEGEVSKVAQIPGLGKMVMVRHGDYFTVYTKLKDVYVQMGQKVNTKDELGTVLTDNEGVSEVKFSVWKNSESMNPKLWLNPR